MRQGKKIIKSRSLSTDDSSPSSCVQKRTGRCVRASGIHVFRHPPSAPHGTFTLSPLFPIQPHIIELMLCNPKLYSSSINNIVFLNYLTYFLLGLNHYITFNFSSFKGLPCVFFIWLTFNKRVKLLWIWCSFKPYFIIDVQGFSGSKGHRFCGRFTSVSLEE